MVKHCWLPDQQPNWRATLCCLSMTAYKIIWMIFYRYSCTDHCKECMLQSGIQGFYAQCQFSDKYFFEVALVCICQILKFYCVNDHLYYISFNIM
jgi:hypothetical protein